MKGKKIISILLSATLLFSSFVMPNVTVFANDTNSIIDTQDYNYTVEDIKQLEQYITVNEIGFFELDKDKALNDGFEKSLIDGQLDYLDILNSRAKDDKIIINDDLSIETLEPIENDIHTNDPMISLFHWYSCGGGRNTSTTEYWWGYSRYACDCSTNELSANFNSVSAGSAGVAVVAGFFSCGVGALAGGVASSYWWLLASRLDANNRGRGVFIEMTWALIFDITPQ